MSLRDYFLLEYADILQTSPQAQSFWRVTCDYLAAAGDEGRNRLKNHILHISLNLEPPKATEPRQTDGELMEVEEPPVDEDLRHFTEVREACEELRLEDEWRTMSKIVAERLIRKGEYGMAAAMCLQAEDSFTLSLIAERICDAYLAKGKLLVWCNRFKLINRRCRVPETGRYSTSKSSERSTSGSQPSSAGWSQTPRLA
jgi:nuclear pore complex protein Nup85